MGEVRAVDDQQNVRFCGHDGRGGLVDPRDEFRQLLENLREAHDGEFGIVEQGGKPLRLQRFTANAHQFDRTRISGFERSDQIRAQEIAGYFACNYRHF